jgi:hypothetical protein
MRGATVHTANIILVLFSPARLAPHFFAERNGAPAAQAKTTQKQKNREIKPPI